MLGRENHRARPSDLESQYLEAKVVVVEDEPGVNLVLEGQGDPPSGFEKSEAQTQIWY